MQRGSCVEDKTIRRRSINGTFPSYYHSHSRIGLSYHISDGSAMSLNGAGNKRRRMLLVDRSLLQFSGLGTLPMDEGSIDTSTDSFASEQSVISLLLRL